MNKIDINNVGINERFIIEATLYEGLYIGRISAQYQNLYKVITEEGEVSAEVSGKFRFNVKNTSDYPVVGDFVMLDRTQDVSGNAIIHHILTRKSVFIRKAAGTSHEEQALASNVDTVFVCMSLNNDFNIRRIERYLGIAWDSGAVPVIVLTKSDLCSDLSEKLEELNTVACGVDIVVTSSMDEDSYLALGRYLDSGKTAVFIGSSGVGKSSLINRLLGKDIIKTSGIRNDDKGRHTTTTREMFVIPSGGILIDTPGIREIGLENADISKAFSEIDELSLKCRFSDCTHVNEPGCAVRNAIELGLLSAERLESYLKLKKEARYEGLSSRQIENKKFADMFKEVGGMKNARKLIKSKSRRSAL